MGVKRFFLALSRRKASEISNIYQAKYGKNPHILCLVKINVIKGIKTFSVRTQNLKTAATRVLRLCLITVPLTDYFPVIAFESVWCRIVAQSQVMGKSCCNSGRRR